MTQPSPSTARSAPDPAGTGPGAAAAADTIQVLRGHPTPEELAAAVAVVRYAISAGPAETVPPTSGGAWGSLSRTVPRRVPPPGPDSWRTSYWPG